MRQALRALVAIASFVSLLALAAAADAADKSVAQSGSENGKPEQAGDALVPVQRVEVIASPVGPVVVLRIPNKSVPVFVDPVVAISIQSVLAGEEPRRPLSHDLMRTVLDSLGAKVIQAVITLKDRVYYGELTILVDGRKKVFDARSSDAIALALRFKAPIYVDRPLIEAAGVEPPTEKAPEAI
jgi:bifunctional DNase/RNase